MRNIPHFWSDNLSVAAAGFWEKEPLTRVGHGGIRNGFIARRLARFLRFTEF